MILWILAEQWPMEYSVWWSITWRRNRRLSVAFEKLRFSIRETRIPRNESSREGSRYKAGGFRKEHSHTAENPQYGTARKIDFLELSTRFGRVFSRNKGINRKSFEQTITSYRDFCCLYIIDTGWEKRSWRNEATRSVYEYRYLYVPEIKRYKEIIENISYKISKISNDSFITKKSVDLKIFN